MSLRRGPMPTNAIDIIGKLERGVSGNRERWKEGKVAIIYRSNKWFDTQAKTLETKILKAKGSSLTYSGIGRELARNAIIEIQGNMLV